LVEINSEIIFGVKYSIFILKTWPKAEDELLPLHLGFGAEVSRGHGQGQDGRSMTTGSFQRQAEERLASSLHFEAAVYREVGSTDK